MKKAASIAFFCCLLTFPSAFGQISVPSRKVPQIEERVPQPPKIALNCVIAGNTHPNGTVDAKSPRKVTAISMTFGALPFDDFKGELDTALRNL